MSLVDTQEWKEEGDRLAADVSALKSRLSSYELRWRGKQPFLETKGYRLRPRYHPQWTPSWGSDGWIAINAEDAISLPFRPNLIDATRICDGLMVYLKRVETGDEESNIATYFSSGTLRNDLENHCVPVLEVIQDEEEPNVSYVVMPYLRLIDDPPFAFVNDVVDLTDQLLEGLVYMHKHGVAHRDCARKNLMMDAFALYPRGFHPVRTQKLPDNSARAGYWPRIIMPVKYYYVDFGIAIKVPLEQRSTVRVTGVDGLDQDVPELSMETPYDPFKVDIFILGNVFQQSVYAKFSNVEFIRPLVKAMTEKDPKKRPDAVTALKQWREIRGCIFLLHRGWRLHERGESTTGTIIFDVLGFMKLGILLSHRFLVWAARLLTLFRRVF